MKPVNLDLAPIVIIGAGGHARVIAEIIRRQGVYRVAGYTAPRDQAFTDRWEFSYLGDDSVLPDLRRQGIVTAALGVGGVGDNRPRSRLYGKIKAFGFSFPPLMHPAATVAGGVTLADGAVIAPGAVVNPGVAIGPNTIINSAAVVEHDCIIGEHVHVSPRAVLCGGVRVERLAHVGAGAVVIQGVTIGEGAVVGAGAVVLDNVPPCVVVAGNPARARRLLRISR